MKEQETVVIPKEKFEFATQGDMVHDKKLQTKPVGYFKDAFRRFCKNKGAVVAAIVVIILILFALIGPACINSNYTDAYVTDSDVKHYQYLSPKLFNGGNFWSGRQKKTAANESDYYQDLAIGEERGCTTITEFINKYEVSDVFSTSIKYDYRVDSYRTIGTFTKTLMPDEYKAIMDWQDEHQIQVILPSVDRKATHKTENIWYKCQLKGKTFTTKPELDEEGNFIPAYVTYATADGRKDDYTSTMRLAKDPYVNGDTDNGWSYAKRGVSSSGGYNYTVRVDPYNYFIYKYDFEPKFAFGTEANGYDIFTRLASGARFSMLLAICISAVNLVIGAIYGAIEGFYGGKTDLIMERISDILSAVPTMIVVILFNLHLSAKLGAVPALIYAFIVTGWIGMAGTTRMQFYRFKNQEYVLAARTLGAKDRRLIWKHIFPNALGTLITSSVLVIPGVIFSETSLSYLGIINLDSPTRSSVGAMLSAGNGMMTKYPFLVLFPALFIGLLMVCFNLFGNGLRDAFNPNLRGSEG